MVAFLALYPLGVHYYYSRWGNAQAAYPLRSQQQVPVCQKQDRCVFIVSVGRSGSTALMDAMNQMPGVYVRGENWNMMQYLYNLDQAVQQNSARSDVSLLARQQWGKGKVGPKDESDDEDKESRVDDVPLYGSEAEKQAYEALVANRNKPAWYSAFQRGRNQCAASSFFKNIFGYDDFGDQVVGFKEIRYAEELDHLLQVKDVWPWQGNRASKSSYAKRSYLTYERYLDFLRRLCHDSKIVFNIRRDVDYDKGQGFYLGRGTMMKEIVDWMDRYRRKKGNSVARTVYYEDMFGAQNKTLAIELAKWLGVWSKEEEATFEHIRFDRLPRT